MRLNDGQAIKFGRQNHANGAQINKEKNLKYDEKMMQKMMRPGNENEMYNHHHHHHHHHGNHEKENYSPMNLQQSQQQAQVPQ